MRPALALLLALLATLLWPAGLADRGLRPDLLLLLSVGAGLFGGARTGCAAGVAAGLLAAPLSVEPFGLDAALLGGSGMLAGGVAVYLSARHVGVQACLAGGLALSLGLLRLLRLEISGAAVGSLGLLPAVALGALATAVAAPPALLLLDALAVYRARPRPGRPSLV